MSSIRSILLLGGALAVGVVGTEALAADEPVNIVKYRKATMTAIGGHMSKLAAIAKGEVSFTDDAFGAAHSIHEMSLKMERLFPEGTGEGETEEESRALPAIWEQPDEFQAIIVDLQEESKALAELTEEDGFDQAAFGQQFGKMGKAGCGACHETFRAESD